MLHIGCKECTSIQYRQSDLTRHAKQCTAAYDAWTAAFSFEQAMNPNLSFIDKLVCATTLATIAPNQHCVQIAQLQIFGRVQYHVTSQCSLEVIFKIHLLYSARPDTIFRQNAYAAQHHLFTVGMATSLHSKLAGLFATLTSSAWSATTDTALQSAITL